MKLLIALALCFLVVVVVSHPVDLTEEYITKQWTDFKVKFDKKYPDEKEELKRKQLFTDNLKRIEEHNEKYRKGEISFSQKINQFADLTTEETRPYTHGLIIPKTEPKTT